MALVLLHQLESTEKKKLGCTKMSFTSRPLMFDLLLNAGYNWINWILLRFNISGSMDVDRSCEMIIILT